MDGLPTVTDRPLAARHEPETEGADLVSDATPPPPPEPPGPRRSRLGVLRHKDFRTVWLGAMGSSVGSWMESTGVRWIVALSGSALLLGYLTAAQMVPMLVLGMAGGLMADRVNRKTLLLVTQFAMMLIAAALAVASHLGYATPLVLITLSLLQGVMMAFNIPAWQVLTPRLVPREELTSAIALNGLQFNLARVVGPTLGGWILAAWVKDGATILFVVNTISFLGVLGAVATTPDAPAPPHDGTSAWVQTRDSLSFVFHNRGPRAVFMAIVIFAMLGGPLLTMLPLFVHEVYHLEADSFGHLLSLMGAGAVAGVFALRWIPKWYPKHHFIPLSILASGIAVTLFAATTSFAVAGICIFFAGTFWLWTFNLAFAAMQLLVHDRMRGRVMAVCNVAAFGATPVGALLVGAFEQIAPGGGGDTNGAGVRYGVMLAGVLLALAGLVMLIWRTPEVDGLKPGDPGYDRRPGLLRGLTASAHRPTGTQPAR
jgi:MFS family permease